MTALLILLRGLRATYYEDINALEAYLQIQGFCTFSVTYNLPKAGSLDVATCKTVVIDPYDPACPVAGWGQLVD
jgi:hypothetical protein